MKKLFLFYIFCTGIFINGMAQNDSSVWVDVVQLNDGSVLKGIIISYDYQTKMEIKLVTGAKIVLAHSVIRSVMQEQVKKDGAKLKKAYNFRERGFYNATDFAIIAPDERTDDMLAAGLSTVFGFQFKRQIGAGLGIGVQNYSLGGNEMIYTLFSEARGYLNKRNVSPFYAIRAGYGFAADHNRLVASKGGPYLSPSVGYRTSASENTNFIMSLGWNFQKASFTYNGSAWINETIEQRIVYKRFFVRLGLLF